VMADGAFPFGAVGLVHLENRIVQHRTIGVDEELALAVRPTALQPHAKGRTFSLITEARAGEELVWESESTMLRRGGSDGAGAKRSYGERTPDGGPAAGASVAEGPASAEWKLGGDLGRRYAAVSGDRNPIHMHSLTAKPLGFPAAIAHGMWTKARCLAALEPRLPDTFTAEVAFRRPILLPGRVEFGSRADGERTDYFVRDAMKHTPHLEGSVK
jgi:acyl dehydratase